VRTRIGRDISLLDTSETKKDMFDSLEEAILLLEQSYSSKDTINFEQVVEFIAGQQIPYGHDAGVFVESRNVSQIKARLYTGERLQTHLAVKIIRTIESARALVLSGSPSEIAQTSIALADSWLEKQCFSDFCAVGECRYSSMAFIRYLNALRKTDILEKMISRLSEFRDGKGGWKGFPYFLTLLALSEIESSVADNELIYALPFTEQRFKRSKSEEPYRFRREEILSRVLNRFGHLLLSHV
jgi:hypothetical protein